MLYATTSRHGQQIDPPSRPGHRPLKITHETPGDIHAARPRPRLACEVSGEDIEQGVSFDGIQAAIRRCVGMVGVQAAHQLRVFLDHDPKGEFRGRRHVTTLKLLPAAGQGERAV